MGLFAQWGDDDGFLLVISCKRHKQLHLNYWFVDESYDIPK
jgi:hypothetical protein